MILAPPLIGFDYADTPMDAARTESDAAANESYLSVDGAEGSCALLVSLTARCSGTALRLIIGSRESTAAQCNGDIMCRHVCKAEVIASSLSA